MSIFIGGLELILARENNRDRDALFVKLYRIEVVGQFTHD